VRRKTAGPRLVPLDTSQTHGRPAASSPGPIHPGMRTACAAVTSRHILAGRPERTQA
jgi:hypothetical protein